MRKIYDELKKMVEYAKESCVPETALYEAYGMIKMARILEAITCEEYMKLNHECVYEGINNPKYF